MKKGRSKLTPSKILAVLLVFALAISGLVAFGSVNSTHAFATTTSSKGVYLAKSTKVESPIRKTNKLVWVLSKKKTYSTITFKANGGTLSWNDNWSVGANLYKKQKTVKNGKKLGATPKRFRAGYSFAGWYTKSKGGKKIKTTTIIKKSMTLYAHWKK